MEKKPKLKKYTARTLKRPTARWEPPHWALEPTSKTPMLEVYKQEGVITDRLYIDRSWVFGKNKDKSEDTIWHALKHPSISRQHAVIIHCAAKEAGGEYEKVKDEDDEIRGLVIVDLHSTHGTQLNGHRLPKGRAVLLRDHDILRFGGSIRNYKLKGSGMARRKTSKEKQKEKDAAREKADEGSPKDKDKDKDRHRDRDAKTKDKEKERKRKHKDKEAEGKRHKHSGKEARHKADKQVQVRHLLVKHRDSRRPSSWKEKVVTRTKEEAISMVEAFRAQVEGGADFEALATTESHCGSAKRGGDLGMFGPGAMQKVFEKASFALPVGGLSPLIDSDSGIHIILRIK